MTVYILPYISPMSVSPTIDTQSGCVMTCDKWDMDEKIMALY